MPTKTSYAPGTPCWVDLGTPDMDGARAFYSGLFGWTFTDQGEEAGHYHMCELRGLPVAGAMTLAPEMQAGGVPPNWTTYIATDDADTTAKKIEAAGGTVMMPPMDVMDIGRMAMAMDPTGAAFGIWQPRTFVGAGLVNEAGALCWNELTVRDAAAAVAFYTEVFPITINEIGVGDPDAPFEYRELQVDGQGVGGIMQMGDEFPPEVPSHWMTYFAVDDCDAAAARITELGGSVSVPPTDIEPGRFAVCGDPAGAYFSIIKLNAPT